MGRVEWLFVDHKNASQSQVVWEGRLARAKQQGLSALEALHRMADEPEDPEGGQVASGVPEQEAPSLDALIEMANPGWTAPAVPGLAERATWPDGTPVDRSKGWGALSPFEIPETDYPTTTGSAVRYLPVMRMGNVLGYLWAAVADDAAFYVERDDAGDEGWNAGGPWVLRLREAQAMGLTPLEALRHWVGAPEDAAAGGVPADAQELEAPSLRALKVIAGVEAGDL
ncbi:hypothetical protein [Spirillospora sp. CA-294931]|uniref:hypothetical protein n=1 Tax=Spirillospora sp. CA-294931 TaxID=3240042 RepID=UPI003D918029